MGSFDRNQVCNTNLALGLGSVVNLIGKSPEKNQEEASNHLSLNLNLVVGEQSDKNCSSEEYKMNNGKNSVNGSRKKLRLSKEQSSVLEESFKHHCTLNIEQKNSLASQLNLTPRQVEVWFQNRRARTKLKLTETDCERWKKGYKEMSEENKRLKEEVEKLQTSKRIKLNGSTNFSEARLNAGSSLVCPNCRRGWLMTGDDVGSGDDRPFILKPKPNYGSVKLLG